jgi:hypothetical protein
VTSRAYEIQSDLSFLRPQVWSRLVLSAHKGVAPMGDPFTTNTMRVQDFTQILEANNKTELEAALTKRYQNGVNGFWLSRDANKYPVLSILVKGDLASVHYFPKERHPGFTPVGKIEGLKPGGTTTFFLDTISQKQEVLNDAIVPFTAALTAAKEFLFSKELPQSIEWLEL